MACAIEEAAGIEIFCLVEEGGPAERFHKKLLEEANDQIHESDGQFYRGTLRRKQILESERSIVIIGDVEEGATVGQRPENMEDMDKWGIAVLGNGVKVAREVSVPAKAMIYADVTEDK